LFVCPLGTATVERSFSVMCTRLRQRLTAEHLNDLMAISVEGPDTLSRSDWQAIAYYWFAQRSRRACSTMPVDARKTHAVRQYMTLLTTINIVLGAVGGK